MPLTPLIGRESAIHQLLALIADPAVRLLTLTGPGGVGKTRLALAGAEHVRVRGDLEVTVLSLAALTDPDLVAPTIGQAFGLSDVDVQTLPERLAFALKDRPTLLMLDNYEQLLSAAPLLSTLLTTSPILKLLVTSRVVLRLSVERDFPVAPLALPQPGDSSGKELTSPAVRLFLERASLNERELTPEDWLSAHGICRHVDGLPLAIELAAAKTRLLSLPELFARMDRALPLLVDGPRDAPARLQTMRNAIAWSFDLLTPGERDLACTLSIFAGGFTIADAAASAGSDEPDVLQAMQSLLDHSIIRRSMTAEGNQRLSMLETIREYGQEQLTGSGREQGLRDRHAQLFAARFELEDIGDIVHTAVSSLHIAGEEENFRSALQWSIARGNTEIAARLALAMAPFWWRQGYFTEGREAIASILAMAGSTPLPGHRALLGLASDFAYFQSDFEVSGILAAEALEFARTEENLKAVLYHLRQVAWVNFLDPPSAIPPAEEIVELAAKAGDTEARIAGLHLLAMGKVYFDRLDEAIEHAAEARPLLSCAAPVESSLLCEIIQLEGTLLFYAGDHERAEPLLTQALALRREQGNKIYELHCLRDIGRIAFACGDSHKAATRFAAALELAYLLGSDHCKSYCFDEAAAVSRDLEAAAQLLGAGAAIRNRLKLPSIATERNLRAETTSRVTETLGTAQFHAAFNAGGSLSSMEAYNVARHALSTVLDEPAGTDSLLTLREREVLVLISEGKSDREIGDALFVSRRTAATHVRNILTKLDVHSRAEAAAWAVRNDLA